MVGSALGALVGRATVLVEGHVTGNSFFSIEKVPEARSGGTTQAETRVYNERLVVSLVRRHGQLSKVDLTRLTGLAPQTITTIVNRAADSELLVRREALRGRLGQPSVPYALNAAAAYSFGLKVDHRSADVALINFVGEVLALEQTTFDYPMPDEVMHFAKSATARICRKHKSISRIVSRVWELRHPSTSRIGRTRLVRRPVGSMHGERSTSGPSSTIISSGRSTSSMMRRFRQAQS